MTISVVAKRYANAFYEIARERNSFDEVSGDFRDIRSALKNSPEFEAFVKNPSFSSHERLSILTNLFDKKVSKVTFELLTFLSTKNRLPLLGEICHSMADLYRKDKGIIQVKIHSSRDLPKDESDSIVSALELKLNKKIEPRFFIDPALIGGVKVQIRDRVYDYSLSSQLNHFKEQLYFG